ncbi:MAG: multicopper oxidase domain-containing protein [Caldilineaceae bacterium]
MDKVNRRSFLKGAAAVTGAALVGVGQTSLVNAESTVATTTTPVASAAHSAHANAAAPLTNLSVQVAEALKAFQPLPRVATNVALGAAIGPDLLQFQPARLESKDGLLEYDLTAEFMDYEIYQGRIVTLRSYNRSLPAPTLVIKPGDTLRINHYNDMPVLDESAGAAAGGDAHGGHHDINHPHGFNVTNLHTHGLYVSPAGNSDNVLIEIEPGKKFVYEYKVPKDHHSGLFWYHPHKHGSSAVQLTSGMAGGLIVTGGDDDLRLHPLIKNTKEVFLIVHQMVVNPPESDKPLLVPEYLHEALVDRVPFLANLTTTVNGLPCAPFFADRGTEANPVRVPLPTIRLRPGELQHWRIIQSALLRTSPVELVEGADNDKDNAVAQTMYVAAHDGISKDFVEGVTEVMFASGNRLDLLIKLDKPGTYTFRFKSYNDWPAADPRPAPVAPLFNVIVEGEPMNDRVPHLLSKAVAQGIGVDPANPSSIYQQAFWDANVVPLAYWRNLVNTQGKLPVTDITDSEIVRRREVKFSAQGKVDKNIDERQFLVNGGKFNANVMDFTMLTNTAEEWVISSDEIQDHPFHIHINPIQVTKIGDQVLYPPRWCDTINVPTGKSVTIRHRFGPYTGTAVFHCHILTHEDSGMMALIELVDPTPVTATIAPVGGTLLSPDPEPRVTVRFPARSVSADTDVTYGYMIKPDSGYDPTKLPQWGASFAQALPTDLGGVDRFFALTAKRGGTDLAALEDAAVITVSYMNPDNPAITDTAALYRWDATKNGWSTDGITVRSRTAKSLIATTTQLGQFAVLYKASA